jgi:hypothetical protein
LNQRSYRRKRTREEEEEKREEEVSSSPGSSPIRVPRIPDDVYRRFGDPDTRRTLEQAETDYDAKLGAEAPCFP